MVDVLVNPKIMTLCLKCPYPIINVAFHSFPFFYAYEIISSYEDQFWYKSLLVQVDQEVEISMATNNNFFQQPCLICNYQQCTFAKIFFPIQRILVGL